MSYAILRFAHFIGLTLMGAGLLGVFLTDLRSRQLQDLALFTEAVRNIAVFYDGLVVPRVAEIVFLSLRIGANVLRRHQPGIVTKTLELATDMR